MVFRNTSQAGVGTGQSITLTGITKNTERSNIYLSPSGGLLIQDIGYYLITWGWSVNNSGITTVALQINGSNFNQYTFAQRIVTVLSSSSAIVNVTVNPTEFLLVNLSTNRQFLAANNGTAVVAYITAMKLQ